MTAPRSDPPRRTFSQSRVARGPQLFLAGQAPLDTQGELAGETMTAQADQVLDNLAGLLAERGLTFTDTVRMTYYLTDMSLLDEFRAVLLRRLPIPPPTASLVEVNALIDPRFLVEIDAVAVLPEGSE